MVSTPLGRRIGAAWLMHPGRRLHRRLVGAARDDRQARDDRIRAEHQRALTAENERHTGDTVPHAPRNHDSTNTEGDQMPGKRTGGFLFEESASEMETAAQRYAPSGAMRVLATVEGFPEALTSIANTFRILAERCDSAFPVHPEVGQALADVHALLEGLARHCCARKRHGDGPLSVRYV